MAFLKKHLYNNTATILWFSVIGFVLIKHFLFSKLNNNYFIYKYAYLHAAEGKSLYGYFPGEYLDKIHYGPLFSLIITPYALLPDWLGYSFWVVTLVTVLFIAVKNLPVETWQKNLILLIACNEILTTSLNVQFNAIIAALTLFTFTLIHKEKNFWAPLPLLIGTFVKLYSIVGLAFFFLVKDKPKFILGCIVWSLVLFVLPMLISSPTYVISMYQEWFNDLVLKNNENISLTSHQDISVMGFVRRLFQDPLIPNWPFLLFGVIIFGIPYLRIKSYSEISYSYLLLSSVLIFPVIFSSAAEGPTYILPFIGIGIWFAIQPDPRPRYTIILLVLAFLFASLNSTDLYPSSYRIFLREHSVKAIPCLLIWLAIVYEMTLRNLKPYRTNELPTA